MRTTHLLLAALLSAPSALWADTTTPAGTTTTLPGTPACEITWTSASATVGAAEGANCWWVTFYFAATSNLADHNPTEARFSIQAKNPITGVWEPATFITKGGKYGLGAGTYRAVGHAICQKGDTSSKTVNFTVPKP
jgi:hypothetical protein